MNKMPTLGEAKSALLAKRVEINTLLDRLSSLFADYKSEQIGSVAQQRRIEDTERQVDTENQNFFEQKAGIGDRPVSPLETLQQFVVYFFIAAVALFGIALVAVQGIKNGGGAAVKAGGLYLFFVFIAFAMMLRFA